MNSEVADTRVVGSLFEAPHSKPRHAIVPGSTVRVQPARIAAPRARQGARHLSRGRKAFADSRDRSYLSIRCGATRSRSRQGHRVDVDLELLVRAARERD